MSAGGAERVSAGGAERDEAARRRRREAVFGEGLPETTRDERDPGEGTSRAQRESAGDAWLRAQVPPHHG